jgi:hypothetical protein
VQRNIATRVMPSANQFFQFTRITHTVKPFVRIKSGGNARIKLLERQAVTNARL